MVDEQSWDSRACLADHQQGMCRCCQIGGQLPGQCAPSFVSLKEGPFVGQCGDGEVVEGLTERYVDMYGQCVGPSQSGKGFVDEAVDIPVLLGVVWLGQRDACAHKAAERSLLGECLSVELSDPCGRAVGGDDDEWGMTVACLSHGGVEIEQRCP